MLKPAGKAFARVAVASTLCPACAQRIEHSVNWTTEVKIADTQDGIRTSLVANRTIVIHRCLEPHG